LIVDYHIHTKASSDGKGTFEDYARKAKEREIAEIGFSDHIDKERLNEPSEFYEKMMVNYVEDFVIAKGGSDVELKLGCEVDYFPDRIVQIRKLLKDFPVDYVIGSVHYIGSWGVDDHRRIDEHSRRDALEAYEEYFGLVREMCTTGLFDIVGHPDLIKIFCLRPESDLSQIYKETARAIAGSHMSTEINAKGLTRPCREIYPALQFLEILRDYSVPITFGSDAHDPKDLGLNLIEAVKLAKRAGYTEACTFTRRKKASFQI
jgi:histidinol-phosphatase (PHP family)